MCEAIESHCAESAPADGPFCALQDLAGIAPDLEHFSRSRDAPPPRDMPLRWCTAKDLMSGRELLIPHDFVSLDFTREGDPRLERSSAGLGLGATEDAAAETALLELVERDAIGEWRRASSVYRLQTIIDPATIPFSWFDFWRDRLRKLDFGLKIFAVPSLTGTPVFACHLTSREAFGSTYRSFAGFAANEDAELALFRALAEALQSRLTFTAAARDDILPNQFEHRALSAAALPHPPSIPRLAWRGSKAAPAGWRSLAERLSSRGHPQILLKRLDPGLPGLAVLKVMVPGLGSLTRSRKRR